MAKLAAQKWLLVSGAFAIEVLIVTSLVLGRAVIDRCGGWSGCDANGLPLGSVTVRDLESHPEAALYYPGATVIDHGGLDEEDPFLGRPGSAYTTSVLATSESAGPDVAEHRGTLRPGMEAWVP